MPIDDRPSPSAISSKAIPIFSPDGTLKDVPYEQMVEAVKNGGQVALKFRGPDGKVRLVPANRMQDAVANKGKLMPIEYQFEGIPEWYGFTPSNIGRNMWQGGKGLVKSLWDAGEDLVSNPNWLLGKTSTAEKFVFAPSREMQKKIEEALERDDWSSAMGYAIASGMPLVGPWAAGLGEQAGRGDIGGAAGQMAGTIAGAKALELGSDFTKAGLRRMKSPTVTAQRMAKTGPGMTEKVAAQQVERTLKQIDEAARAGEEWVAKEHEARGADREQAKAEARRDTLEHVKARTYPDLVKENVTLTHRAVRNWLNKRWNAWRTQLGEQSPVPNGPRAAAIAKARAELSGVPADLAIFNQIMKELEEPPAKTDKTAAGVEGQPPTVDTAEGRKPVLKESTPLVDYHRQHTALGEKAFEATGNVGRVLREVYEASAKPLDELSNAKGLGKEYELLKRDWSRYMSFWYDYKSPLARLRKFRPTDRAQIGSLVLGAAGETLRSMLGGYRNLGGNPDLMSKMIAASEELKKIPARRTVAHPERPVAGPISPSTVATIAEEVRKAKQARSAEVSEEALTGHRYDVVMGLLALGGGHLFGHTIAWPIVYTIARFGEGAFLSSDIAKGWLSRITPEDIGRINQVLARVPEERPEVAKAIADGLIEKVDNNEPIPAPGIFSRLLNNDQMRGLLRAIMAKRGKGAGPEPPPAAPGAQPPTAPPAAGPPPPPSPPSPPTPPTGAPPAPGAPPSPPAPAEGAPRGELHSPYSPSSPDFYAYSPGLPGGPDVPGIFRSLFGSTTGVRRG